MELDHIFLLIEPGGPEHALLARAGLVETWRRDHPGQGTTNACFVFDNAYLELLWVVDPDELTHPAIAPTGLGHRAGWRANGASPFGLAWRSTPRLEVPVETWDYRPPYLPPDMAIPVAALSRDPRQPFCFGSPGTTSPMEWPASRQGTRQQSAGFTRISAALRPHAPVPDDLRRLASAGLLTLGPPAPAPRLELHLQRPDGRCARLHLPECRLDEA